MERFMKTLPQSAMVAVNTAVLTFLFCQCTSAAADESEILITRNSRFEIPFELDTEPDEEVDGFAVLYGSQDDGETWTRLQSVPASRGSFIFTAAKDGRYSFAIRMADERGTMIGEIEGSKPELLIEVDTKVPEVDVKVTEPMPGKARVVWSCSDPGVVAESMKMEVVDGTTGTRRLVQVEPLAEGSTVLPIPAGGMMQVRVSFEDLAGNRGETRIDFESETSLFTRPEMQSPEAPADPPEPGTPIKPIGPTPFPNTEPTKPEPMPEPEPAPSPEPPPMPKPEPAPEPEPMPAPQPPPLREERPEPNPTPRPEPIPTPVERPVIPDLPPTLPPTQPPVPEPEPQPEETEPPADDPGLHYVSNRMFSLEYAVDDVGPSGVSAVDLFVTENGGKQWFRYGSDSDRKSPFQIDTMGEGTFGFAIRIRNGVGVADIPPQPGEAPEILITVDQTPPVVEMAQPVVRKGRANSVQFTWRIREINPATESVRLEMSAASGGKWMPIFDWQADRGGFEMPIPEGLPPAVHFRLTARDAAGNLTSAQTVRPVVVDMHKPSGRLLRITPGTVD